MRRPEVIDPMTRQRIHIHAEAGLTHAHIASLTKTSESTVQRVLKEPPPTPADLASEQMLRPHAGRPGITSPWLARVVSLLSERPDLPTTEALRIATTEWKYPGSRATFFRLVHRVRPAPVPEPMVRFEGLPGEFAQFDFGQAVVTYTDGKTEKVHIFVGRLKFSRQVQVFVVPNEQAETLIRCVVACCHAWGGSPLAWVFDNPTTVRLSKTGELPVRLNPYLQHLAGELRVAVELCAPRSGNQKGSVERGVGWAKNSFLLVRQFVDHADLETQLASWLVEINTNRRCDATKAIPATLLAQESKRLGERPVPWTADDYPLRESATVTPVATVVIRGTPYQVDPRAIGTVATVLVRRDTIEVITVRDTKAVHPRRDPSLCTTSLFPPHGFTHLHVFDYHWCTVFPRSTCEPSPRSRRLNAGHLLDSNQVTSRINSQDKGGVLVSMTSKSFRHLISGSFAFASVDHICQTLRPDFSRIAHDLDHGTKAASGDLKSGPETRFRETCSHLACSMSLLGYHGPILSRLRGAPPLGPRLLSLPTHQAPLLLAVPARLDTGDVASVSPGRSRTSLMNATLPGRNH
jgi:transposase